MVLMKLSNRQIWVGSLFVSFLLGVSLTKSTFGLGTAVYDKLPGIMTFNLSAKS